MEAELTQLKAEIVQHIHAPAQMPLRHLGIFHTHDHQALRSVPIQQPSLICVIEGCKTLHHPVQDYVAETGAFLAIPADITLNLTNMPAKADGCYLALTLGFDRQVLEHYRKLAERPLSVTPQQPIGDGMMSSALVQCLRQWVVLCQQSAQDVTLHRVKALEVLAHLDGLGALPTLLAATKPSWKQKVITLIQTDLTRSWQLADLCSQLATSESSLRRHLQHEDTSFRSILEETRLVTALGMLQESYRPIGHIALDVGYNNQGHFSERFKRRFGMSPSELRQTREPRVAV